MLVNIQFLRFVAAMMVVAYHASFQAPASGDALNVLFSFARTTGFAGVDIFFVISGFIMAYTTMKEAGGVDSLAFARRRLARIYSGYWPFFVFALLVFSWARPAHVEDSGLFASFVLWPQPLNRTLLEITWTLSFELYFYLLFTLVVLLVPPRSRRRLCVLLAVGVGAAASYRHFAIGSFNPESLYLMPFPVHFLFSPFLAEFFTGAAIAYWLARRPNGRALPWLLGGFAVFVAGGWINEAVYAGGIEQGYHVVPRVLCFGTASAFLVTGLVRLEQNGRKLPASFSIRTGGASYAIYLSHVPVLALTQKLGLPTMLENLPSGTAALAYIALMLCILVLCVLHYENLERPLYRLFKRWLGAPSRNRD